MKRNRTSEDPTLGRPFGAGRAFSDREDALECSVSPAMEGYLSVREECEAIRTREEMRKLASREAQKDR